MSPMTSTEAESFRGSYGFADAARMEWIKLRTLRSTWATLGITLVAAVAVAVAVGLNTRNASGDLTNNSLAGIAIGLLTMGVLGVLVMTGEYTSGSIRSTFATIPNRPLVLGAKAAVFGLAALVVGELAAFTSFLAGAIALPADVTAPTLSQSGVVQAVTLSGAGFCLIGLLGLGLGAVVRHTGSAVGLLVGGVYVLAQILGAAAPATMAYIPVSIVANSLSTTRPLAGMLSPWAGLAVLCLYAGGALGIAGWLLARRDA